MIPYWLSVPDVILNAKAAEVFAEERKGDSLHTLASFAFKWFFKKLIRGEYRNGYACCTALTSFVNESFASP
jgi:hypothetical protein